MPASWKYSPTRGSAPKSSPDLRPFVRRRSRTTAQYQPTGIDRINAEVSTSAGRTGLRVDNGQPVDVAVIDTGIDLTHPDLVANIGGSVNFVDPSKNGNDDNGHGSHVAGIIAAVNNNLGVVGVAPNARLWADLVGISKNGWLF